MVKSCLRGKKSHQPGPYYSRIQWELERPESPFPHTLATVSSTVLKGCHLTGQFPTVPENMDAVCVHMRVCLCPDTHHIDLSQCLGVTRVDSQLQKLQTWGGNGWAQHGDPGKVSEPQLAPLQSGS